MSTTCIIAGQIISVSRQTMSNNESLCSTSSASLSTSGDHCTDHSIVNNFPKVL